MCSPKDPRSFKEGETLVVRVENEAKLRVPVHTLSSVLTFGQVWCSPPALAFCAERGVSVAFLKEHGGFLARVEGGVSGNVALRRQQYRWADSPEISARLARTIILAKISNGRTVLLRGAREAKSVELQQRIQDAAEHLGRVITGLPEGLSLEILRGEKGCRASLLRRL